MANLQLPQEKLDALRSEYKQRNSQLKYPRPKTKPEYQHIYPWLLPDETDPHFVFCVVCECRLSAKRSDLGKHECSIKHKENAYKKGLLSTKINDVNEGAPLATDMKWEYNDEQFGSSDENLMQFASNISRENKNDGNESGGDPDVAADDVDNDDDGETYEPTNKRRSSDTDSQHSGLLDFLPLKVTINESQTNATTQMLSNMNHKSGNMLPQYQPAPCRITIKKVTAPMIKPTAIATPNEITTKATITPIVGSYALPQQATTATTRNQQHQHQQHQNQQQNHRFEKQPICSQNITSSALSATTTTSVPTATAAMRDSFDLFFDSICSTVKALPPKLATEGKIRVMQLIGELEMRSINEREAQQQLMYSINGVPTTATAAGQQNATVASTTK